MNNPVVYFDPLSADQPITVADTATTNTTTTTGTAATTTAAANPQEMSPIASIATLVLPLLLMAVVFYFFLIRPQRKKDKEVKNMLDALKTGDRVCTIGGIYGTVDRLKDDTVTILVGAERTKMVMAKWAIRSVENATVENDASPEV